MQLTKLDPTGKPWNEAVLHALGAGSIAYPTGTGGVVEAVIVSPDIDLSGYAAAVAAEGKRELAA